MPLTEAATRPGTTKSPWTTQVLPWLVRGLLAGLLAGLLSGAVGFVLGEPRIEAAIAIEESSSTVSTAADHHETSEASTTDHRGTDKALVSRPGQHAGLFLATGVGGAAIGAVFGSVYALLRLRPGRDLPSGSIMVTAFGAWSAVCLVPFLRYPPNPPAVGDPSTIELRTTLWGVAVGLGVLAVVLAVLTWRAMPALAPLPRAVVALLAQVAVICIGTALLPAIDEVPAGFPASLLWSFRLASLATQTTLWVGVGVIFALMVDRSQRAVRDESLTSRSGTS